jgi:hypothetical protein
MPLNNRKTTRELKRVLSQANSLLLNVVEPLTRWLRKRDPNKHLHINANPVHQSQGKMAVLLVYQPQGLAVSTWMTLEHLQGKGYSTLLVSNCALSPTDAARALTLCWRTIVRKNFGYDFGGYQDAVMHMMAEGVPMRQLLILNDSIWFPLHTNCSLLDRMEAKPAGFVGAFQLEPTRNKQKMKGKKRPFMGSFFWHFKEPVLRSEAFKNFWLNYKATSSKYATIRRGERRFTHHLLDAGIAGEAMYSRNQFDHWLQQLTGHELKQALQELCTTDPSLAKRQMELLAQNTDYPQWDVKAQQLALAITAPQNITATAPLFMVRDMCLPFIKKSADDANVLALGKLVNHWATQSNEIAPCVISEMKSMLRRMGQ